MRRGPTIGRGVVCALGVLLAAASAQSLRAAPITYDEAIDGDIGWNNPFKLFPLDLGVNTVTGTHGLMTDGWDNDTFEVAVPAGARLVALDVVQTDADGDVNWVHWIFEVRAPQGTSLLEILRVPSPGTGSFAALPLEAGTYQLGNTGIAPVAAGPAVSGHALRFAVVPVPEPGGVTAAAALLAVPSAARQRGRRRSH